jgi:D-sedoheptulose 7-phosphate isomerase
MIIDHVMKDTAEKNKAGIRQQFETSMRIEKALYEHFVDIIYEVSQKMIEAYHHNKKILWMGNGGSAADAQHLSCELISKFYLERKALSSVALTTNTSLLTAISNDFTFDTVFERQVEALAQSGDILMGITTSGRSKNVIKAFKKGKTMGTTNIALTGSYTDDIDAYCDVVIAVPSEETPRIQEAHILIGHILCQLVEEALFAGK